MSFFKQFPTLQYEFNLDGVYTTITDIFRYVHIADEIVDDSNAYQYYQIHDGERPDVVSYKLYGTPEYYWTFFIINDHLHKGICGWPLSTEDFNQYMDKEYDGVVINGNYQIVYDSDGLVLDHRDSVAGRFKIGETVVGLQSGATGKLVGKEPKMNQLIIEEVSGTFRENEIIRGQTTLDFITSYQVFDRARAPRYYIDKDGHVATNAVFITQGTPNSEITYLDNREYEEELNDENAKIRVIRPDFIQDFATTFKRLVRQ